MTITIYSKQGCAPCANLKKWLSMKGHQFHEIDVVIEDKMHEVLNLTGFQMVPVTVVEKEGDKKVVAGFNLRELSSII